MRRFYCRAAAVCAVLLGCAVAHAEAKPNVVIILADSLGWDGVGYNGSKTSTASTIRITLLPKACRQIRAIGPSVKESDQVSFGKFRTGRRDGCRTRPWVRPTKCRSRCGSCQVPSADWISATRSAS